MASRNRGGGLLGLAMFGLALVVGLGWAVFNTSLLADIAGPDLDPRETVLIVEQQGNCADAPGGCVEPREFAPGTRAVEFALQRSWQFSETGARRGCGKAGSGGIGYRWTLTDGELTVHACEERIHLRPEGLLGR